ncbi:thioredoxin [Candidatus Pacearchaeota archaeon]|nr:thioredoxin [Candidatus Pacearchaeota archaeon]
MSKKKMTGNDTVPELTKKEFEDFIKSDELVLIDFYAEWCMPCMMMSPIIDELSQKFKDKIKFGKVNVGEESALGQKYDVSSIPNFVLFENGKIKERFVGSISQEDFEEKLNSVL